ncbi:ubiquitin carboxyl-terminal hydrolase 16 isoform X2 [Zootoca vivipara]|uniref:ubiquitin carboxyl-terminal hydrolase 16 isoform X2 n=1 Tax=Zootoca vivipara TaxID=8524 RepID=UPI0015920554|nr:ubiquitin carboxyl-terminal hydrolase 16 isoform X2 [Zootoca vivipara]
MGKRRTKGKNMPPDDSPDIAEPVCKHLRKGLEQGGLKKVLQNVDWSSCQDCRTSDSETREKSEEEAEDRPSIWLCLKCGHTGCGRNSQEKHAIKHYETPRSEPHCLVLSLDNWSVWCYLCDSDVPYNSSSQLGQLVDYVRKQAHVNMQNTASKEEENKPLENKKIKDHRNEEEREKKEILMKDNKLHLNGNAEVTVKGLSNLGNTCFFNAVLQNLSQTPVLRELLKEVKMPDLAVTLEPPEFSITEPMIVTLDQPRPLTLAMCQFLTEMQETNKGTVTPKELFSQICKKAIRFKGYQQQDSQELLRYLLDGMRTEEIQRISAGIFKALNNSTDKENEELKKKIKEYEKGKSTLSFVDRIFGGELTSTIMCEECQTISLVHESFLDLSLPVLNEGGKKKPNNNNNNVRKMQEKEIEDDEDNTGNDSYLKEREETPGTSKHLQKKAKKMAKKQSKNQRRQQKLQEKTGYNLQKVNKHIKFPEVMDLAPFCSVKCKNVVEGSSRVLYSLYGIVEHSGTMRSGHYTAYVKTRATNNQLSDLVLHGKIGQSSETESSKGQWFHISDTHVQPVPLSKVLNSQAYLLFYERLL